VDAKEQLSQKCASYETERSGLFAQIETNREKYEKMFHDFRNEQFERRNLDLRY